jgi:hypothetical protein
MSKAHFTAMGHTIFSAKYSSKIQKKLINPRLGERQLPVVVTIKEAFRGYVPYSPLQQVYLVV